MSRIKPTSYLLILTAIFTSCSNLAPPITPPGQSNGGGLQSNDAITLSFISGMDYRAGYDSTTGGFLGDTGCLKPVDSPKISAPSDLKQTFVMTKIESRSQLSDNLGVGGKVGYKSGITSISASAKFAQEQDISAYSVGVLVKAESTGAEFKLYNSSDNGNIQPELTEMGRKLYDTDYEAFKNMCGDYFLNTLTLGGTYGGYFNFTSYTKEQKQDIEAKLTAQVGVISVDADFSKKMHSLASTSSTTISTFQTGLIDEPATDLDGMIKEATEYNKKLVATCQGYEGLKSCTRTGQFLSYQNFFGKPESGKIDAIDDGSAHLDTLIVLSSMVDRLNGSKKIIDSNPSIYDQATLAAIQPQLEDLDRWTLGFAAAITACNKHIIKCTNDAPNSYGTLPDFDKLDKLLKALPDVSAKLPENCADQQTIYKQVEDKDYVMFLDKKLTQAVTLFCRDMAPGKTPSEYLSLGAQNGTLSDKYYGDYIRGVDKPIYGRRTTNFLKIRIDPNTLIVDPLDTTYAKSTGIAYFMGDLVQSNLQVGLAGQCMVPSTEREPIATIDLQYTTLIFNPNATYFVPNNLEDSSASIVDSKTATIKSGRSRNGCGDIKPQQIRLMLPSK